MKAPSPYRNLVGDPAAYAPPRRQASSVYPTQRALLVMAACAPLTLLAAVVSPGLWTIGGGLIAFVLGLIALDAVLAPAIRNVTPDIEWPKLLFIDDEIFVPARIIVKGARRPAYIDLSIATNALVRFAPQFRRVSPYAQSGAYETQFKVSTHRRGMAYVESLWWRWRGPFGLIWKQGVIYNPEHFPVVPNSKYVTRHAIEFFSRDAVFGQKIQRLRGEGTEFDSLRDFTTGMDRRAIDWKHSARHGDLVAKEYRTERNHNIIIALDTGRLMCEPLAGVPRLDRALNASLLLSYVGLKTGDRIGLYAFDSKPRLMAKPVTGLGAYGQIQRQSAQIDYSVEETNFTLGLTRLGQTLSRRSLIVIFTDFVDTTSAEMMMENIGRLTKKHFVLFIAFKDLALEDYMAKLPQTPEDVSRAVIAAALAKERDLVMAKLRRMGVSILEADLDTLGPDLLNRFLALKGEGKL